MCKGLFIHITQALSIDDTDPEERKVIQAIIPVVDPRALPECAQDIAMGNLTGDRHMAHAKTLAPSPQYARPGSPVEALQMEVAREYLQRAEEFDRELGTPGGVKGAMPEEVK